ncbi:hypothetical protein STEG23_024623, partial [Scotinomys teguina]
IKVLHNLALQIQRTLEKGPHGKLIGSFDISVQLRFRCLEKRILVLIDAGISMLFPQIMSNEKNMEIAAFEAEKILFCKSNPNN